MEHPRNGRLSIGAAPSRRGLAICPALGDSATSAAMIFEQIVRFAMGFQRAVALDGGMKSWPEAGYPVRAGAHP